MIDPAPPASVGFIGLGTMGQPMALNLLRAGIPLHVWNRTSSRCQPLVAEGAIAVATPDDLFAACRTIILMLANEASTDAVLDRSGFGFQNRVAGKLIVIMGTNSPVWSQTLERDLLAAGADYVEAPVSGSRLPAIAGRLVAMIAGASEERRSEVASLIAPLCRQTFDAGLVPSALRLKLAVNLYLITMVTGLAEAASLADRLGLPLSLLQSVLDAGPMASDVSRVKLAKLVAEDFSAQASIRDVSMNCRLVAGAAQEAGFEAPLLTQAMQQFESAEQAGLGDQDMIAVIRAANQAGSPEQCIIAEQLDAYNCRDLERFMACWHEDAIVVSHPGQVLLSGANEIRDHHRRRFNDPALKAVLLGRTVVGDVVVDHEWATRSGQDGADHFEVLAIYTVRDDRITHASFRQIERSPAAP